jgi:hypothetical protein
VEITNDQDVETELARELEKEARKTSLEKSRDISQESNSKEECTGDSCPVDFSKESKKKSQKLIDQSLETQGPQICKESQKPDAEILSPNVMMRRLKEKNVTQPYANNMDSMLQDGLTQIMKILLYSCGFVVLEPIYNNEKTKGWDDEVR